MADGHLGKCKECTKADVSQHYRRTRPARVQYEHERQKTARRRAMKREYVRRHRERNPDKAKARQTLGNAVRDGRIVRPKKCTLCHVPSRVEAHHEDYAKPLDVVWCCRKCHRERFHGQQASVF
jgi:hypothetical protein